MRQSFYWIWHFGVAALTHAQCSDQKQTHDTYLVCNLLKSTTWSSSASRTLSDANYCTWSDSVYGILCDSSSSEIITAINFDAEFGSIQGTLNFSLGWPSNLKKLDIEQQLPQLEFSGTWDWTAMSGLHNLVELDLEDNRVSPSLSEFVPLTYMYPDSCVQSVFQFFRLDHLGLLDQFEHRRRDQQQL